MTDSRPIPAEQLKQFNQSIIKEFRDNAGKVGGPFKGQRMVLLTTTGAKSGNPHTTPLVTGMDGDVVFVVASAAGAAKHPAWYHNLVANPQVKVELGTESFTATASPAGEPKRTQLYAAMEARTPQFTEYRDATSRTIPIVLLTASVTPN